METQFGITITPFGQTRLKIIEFTESLMKLKNNLISQQIIDLEFPKLLIRLMGEYYMNTQLNSNILAIFQEALNSNVDNLIEAVTYLQLMNFSLQSEAIWHSLYLS